MPWDSKTIRSHNKSLHGEKAGHAARIANAVLKSSGSDATALQVANKWAKTHRRASGGYTPPTSSPQRERDAEILSRGRGQSRQTDLNVTPFDPPAAPGGPIDTQPSLNWLPQHMGPDYTKITAPPVGGNRLAPGGAAPQAPTYQTAAPSVNAQGFVPVPQTGTYNLDLTTGAMQPASNAALQGFAQRGLPISGGSAAKSPASNGFGINPATGGPIWSASQIASMGLSPNDPALQPNPNPFAGNAARGGRRANGGPAPMSMSMATPWWTRSEARGEEARPPAGLISGTSGGRQDNIPMNLAPHSHVIPADVVSGWGQGNTSAGALALQHAMSTGPYGTALPRVPMRPPRALTPPSMPRLARGGASDGVRTLVSHGEVIVPPEDVHRIGRGDFDKGHDWIDRLIVDSRKQIIARTRKLAGPVKE